MHQNLGGFFMVRSYYPSECHADCFDFERIEALKPAIEACGISTLSQSPMLGFHKQMDNRIKILEVILLACNAMAHRVLANGGGISGNLPVEQAEFPKLVVGERAQSPAARPLYDRLQAVPVGFAFFEAPGANHGKARVRIQKDATW